MDKFSFISNAEPEALDKMYQDYLKNPDLVDKSWKEFFEGFDFARTNYNLEEEIPAQYDKEFKVINLINGYRTRGHLFTKTNPVRTRRKYELRLVQCARDLETGSLLRVLCCGCADTVLC